MLPLNSRATSERIGRYRLRCEGEPLIKRHELRSFALAIAFFVALAVVSQALAGDGKKDWVMIGHDPANSRNQPKEKEIDASNVGRLTLKWVATTTGDV